MLRYLAVRAAQSLVALIAVVTAVFALSRLSGNTAQLMAPPQATPQQIAALESETGMTLLERRPRGVSLTAAGQTLVGHAESVLADLDAAEALVARVRETKALNLAGQRAIVFDAERAIRFDTVTPAPRHPNTMQLVARDTRGMALADETWLSVGGGFIIRDGAENDGSKPEPQLPYPFRSGAELLARGRESGLTIAELMRANEGVLRAPGEADTHVERVLDVMFACVDRGLAHSGPLPGGLKVMRRAKAIHDRLTEASKRNFHPAHEIMDFVGVYAMAVNEENAAGGRVVTAPTNGAAGVIPAVLRYYRDHCDGANQAGLSDFLMTATAIGALFKLNASISGAEVGCQGEVGVASSMAAAGLCAALGGTNEQIENAAEIAMEHHLGMTCDPIGGLVQIPCIERNAVASIKAITAARLAVRGDGEHHVSLDKAIKTMRETGADMKDKYKETARGGLALNVVEC